MFNILQTLGTLLMFSAFAFGGPGDEPLRNAQPHRLAAPIQAHDISKYSINLMWINRTLDRNQRYLSSAKNQDELVTQLLTPCMKWAAANPQADVCLWYDGVQATPEAVNATQALLDACVHRDRIANLRLRNVRDIPIVQRNPDSFSDQLPIYFRVDILKAIIIVNAVEKEHNQATVFADLDVGDFRADGKRMTKDIIFDATTMDMLSKNGLVLTNTTPMGGRIENKYFQLIDDKRMLNAIKQTIINVNLMRACTALNDKSDLRDQFLCGLGRAVYISTIDDAFSFYDGTAEGARIKARPDIIHKGMEMDAWIDYDPKIHGYAPFGLYFLTRGNIPASQDAKGKWLSQGKMIQFPFPPRVAPGRYVHSRGGGDHATYPDELVHRAPAVGGTVYHCDLWN